MKEAAGEANMTVIAIILIAVIAAIATPIVNNAMQNTAKKACCMNSGGIWHNSKCYTSCNVDAAGKPTGCTGETTPTCD